MTLLGNKIQKVDSSIISYCRRVCIPFSRIAIFIIFFWFGILKVLSLSPASPLVGELLERTLPFIQFSDFLIFFGLFEMFIGTLFLVPRFDRIALFLLAIHMITTVMPLFLLPQITWSAFLVPTLEGQYIIKNVLIIALAMGIASRITPVAPRTNL